MSTTNQTPEQIKQESPAPEKKTGTVKNQNALLRYITILFAVAFLVVTLSLVLSMRQSQDTIEALNQSSVSAMQNAESLQNQNRELSDENQILQSQVSELEASLADAQKAKTEAENELKVSQKQLADTTKAYELLLTAMVALEQEDTEGLQAAMTELEPLQQLLTGEAAAQYAELANVWNETNGGSEE